MGNILHYILKINKNIKIIAYELLHNYIEILYILFPKKIYNNIEIIQGDFLKINKIIKFDICFCNPPYTFQKNKRYYIYFFFKLNYINNIQKNRGEIYFLSPSLWSSDQTEKYFWYGYDSIDSIFIENNFLNVKNTNEIIKICNIEQTIKKLNDIIFNEDIFNNLLFIRSIEKIKEVSFKYGTKIKVNLYKLL